MMFLATYDIENDRLRSKIADRLLAVGLERIQFSVFVGPLTDSQLQKIWLDIEKLIGNHKQSNFVLMPLTPTNIDTCRHMGDAPLDWEYLSGNKLTLIL